MITADESTTVKQQRLLNQLLGEKIYMEIPVLVKYPVKLNVPAVFITGATRISQKYQFTDNNMGSFTAVSA